MCNWPCRILAVMSVGTSVSALKLGTHYYPCLQAVTRGVILNTRVHGHGPRPVDTGVKNDTRVHGSCDNAGVNADRVHGCPKCSLAVLAKKHCMTNWQCFLSTRPVITGARYTLPVSTGRGVQTDGTHGPWTRVDTGSVYRAEATETETTSVGWCNAT